MPSLPLRAPSWRIPPVMDPEPLVGPRKDPSLLPTRNQPRQTTDTAADTCGDGGFSAGAVAGIAVGSVVGFLLLVWLVYFCCGMWRPASFQESGGSISEAENGCAATQHRRRRRRNGDSSKLQSHSNQGSPESRKQRRRSSGASGRRRERVEVRGSESRTRPPVVVQEARAREPGPSAIKKPGAQRTNRPPQVVQVISAAPTASTVTNGTTDSSVGSHAFIVEQPSPARRQAKRRSAETSSRPYYHP